MSAYADFLATKTKATHPQGPTVDAGDIHPRLHDWQAAVVRWAVRHGRAALFEDCGLGKTYQQLEWARLIAPRSLIIAPLSVARQTVGQGREIDIDVRYVRDQSEVTSDGVWITNYEMLDRFDIASFPAVVLDESSILKSLDGKLKAKLIEQCKATPYRLACTATPAPNDVSELCNHAEWLGHMPRNEMLASYFVHDEIGWRPKGHAVEPMYRWIATWAVAMRRPSDLGYDDDGYNLPGLDIIPEVIDIEIDAPGQLFATELGGIGGRSAVRRATLDARAERTIDIARQPGQWIVWCGLNDEASIVARSLGPDAVNVEGSWAPNAKADAFEAFQDGRIRVLVTKPSIAGFGMNFQNCHQMVFLGLGDSYEQYYQSVRRCYRFGQKRSVIAHVVVSVLEQQIVQNVARKEAEALTTSSHLATFNPIKKDTDNDIDLNTRRALRRMLASTKAR